MKKIVRIAWLIILLHLLISVVHGSAHQRLGVTLNTFQATYVLVVITLAPIVAAVLLWTRQVRVGFVLLALSLAGALVFGVYWHYVAESPDNVAHLHAGSSQFLFRATALLLAASEAAGAAVALWGLRKES